ncbi:ankyrin repeat domain-containing protein 39-like [Ornithodoros turicata]|uniref:ankyrin repeat domain-containing protein 39-like n=1 Tax=Ornithodoros turicata TaxID=34597 RepID=UPI0031394A4E
MHHSDGGCSHKTSVPSVCQTLDELDFQKGVWGAAVDGDYEKLHKLLQKGNDPNSQDSYGYTALHYACRQGYSQLVELLLTKGADVNKQTKGGATALHRAAYKGHLKCVQLLLDKNADSMLTDSDGKTALHKAAENGHENVCSVLLKKCPSLRNIKDQHGRTPLECAASYNQELVRILT